MFKSLKSSTLNSVVFFFLFGIFGSATSVEAEKKCTHVSCAITPYGYFELETRNVEKKGPYGTRQERVVDLMLDDRVIGTIDQWTSVVEVYPSRENATLFLVYGGDHGNSCELYRVLELKSKTTFILTDEFGNCRGIVDHRDFNRYRLNKSIVYENAEWLFAHYSAKTEGNWHIPEWYSYRDGRIYEGKKLVSATSDDPEWLMKKKLEKEIPDTKEREALLAKHGNATAAYRAWLTNKARQIDPSKFR